VNKRKKKVLEIVPINQQFRTWTRGTSFTLAMGKTQVMQIIAIDVSKRFGGIGYGHPLLNRYDIVALRSLENRGLVQDHPNYINWEDLTPEERRERMAKINFLHDRYVLTKAGELTIELLKQAGVYQDLKEELMSYEMSESGSYYHFSLGGYKRKVNQ